MMPIHYNTKQNGAGEIVCAQVQKPEWAIREKQFNRALSGALVGIIIFLLTLIGWQIAEAEEKSGYVICMPGDWVHIREDPSRKAGSLGRVECGDEITLDGKEKNGFLHVIGLNLEMEEGWIYGGYVTEDKPDVLEGDSFTVRGGRRVACRKWAGGPRKAWAKSGAEVRVYAISMDWAVTNRGFIQTAYLEVNEHE